MSGGRAPRDADDEPARVRIPVRRAQAGKRRHEVHAAVVGDGRGQALDVGRLRDQAEAVAQPLHDGAADEDAALERVLGSIPDFPRNRRNQAIGGRHRARAGVLQQEAARPISVLRKTRRHAHLPEEGRLLIAGNSGDRHVGDSEAGRDAPVELARGAHVGQHAGGHAEQLEQIVVPGQRVDVEQHGPRRVADVGDVRGAARQLPHEPGIDRPERELTGIGSLARPRDVVQNPGDLAPGKIGIDHEPGTVANERLVAVRLELVAELRGPAILPHDRRMDGLPGLPVPDDRGLALVGDADRRDVRQPHLRAAERLDRHRDLRGPDLLRVVLDPPRLREELSELFLRHRDGDAVVIEQDGARAGGSLVESKDIGHRRSLMQADPVLRSSFFVLRLVLRSRSRSSFFVLRSSFSVLGRRARVDGGRLGNRTKNDRTENVKPRTNNGGRRTENGERRTVRRPCSYILRRHV